MLGVALIAAVLVILGQGYLLYKAARRLLQFDELFQRIGVTLEGYSEDLAKMTSADIDSVLTDHPEVRMFHLRNMAARKDVQNALEEVTRQTPPRRRKAPALPRPDLE